MGTRDNMRKYGGAARHLIITPLLSLILVVALVAQDPTKIAGSDACQECHEAAYQVLEATKHQSSYRTFHSQDETQAILERLGLRSARRAFCVDCHYTSQQAAGRRRARTIAGVSCESCHSPAADWMDIHNNYGRDASGQRATRETETPDHRDSRLDEGARLGMIRPDQPYLLAQNCFQCHTVPREELVNTGEHAAGSDFELVSRLNGEVRHNFQLSNDEVNRAAARDYDVANRNRVLYVLGQMLDLEYALRGLAEATTSGTYAQAMRDRAVASMDRLRAIQTTAQVIAPTIQQILDAAGQADLVPNSNAALAAAADRIRTATQGFVAQHDGSALAALDQLVPSND